MSALLFRPRGSSRAHSGSEVVTRRVVVRLSAALAVVVATAAAVTFFADGILTGAAVAVGNARGTALVLLLVGAPALCGSIVATMRGSGRALFVWTGAVLYMLYNAVLLLFATPFNHLFLIYVAMLSLSIWSVVFLARDIDRDALARRIRSRLPARGIGAYLVAVAILNALVWLRTAIPESLSDEPTDFLTDIGLTTNPVFVQDLAFWLPLTAVAGVLLWRRTAWGYLSAGSILTYGVFEAIGVSCDQWFGYRADPDTSYASLDGVWLFAGLTVVALTVAVLFLANVAGRARRHGHAPSGSGAR